MSERLYQNPAGFNRAERRRAAREFSRIKPALDVVSAADRLWFERHPDRRHYVRHAHPVETVEWETMLGEHFTIPPGIQFYIAVRKVTDDFRMRVWFAATATRAVDFNEDLAEYLFEEMARGGNLQQPTGDAA